VTIKPCASGTSLYLTPMFGSHFGTFYIILIKFFLKEIDMLDATVYFMDSCWSSTCNLLWWRCVFSCIFL